MSLSSSAEGFVVNLLFSENVGEWLACDDRDLVRFRGRLKRPIFFLRTPACAQRKKFTVCLSVVNLGAGARDLLFLFLYRRGIRRSSDQNVNFNLA